MPHVRTIGRWLDANLEKVVILVAYSAMAGIIFVEVIRRYLFSEQAAWSSTVPIYLFLFITWFGASYNTKIRTHLAFTEVRVRLPYTLQFACLVLDSLLWIVFGIIVIVFTVEQVEIARMNFSIVQGTDDIPQWWFYLATPLGWSLLLIRVLQNLWQDYRRFKIRAPFVIQSAVLETPKSD